jgi:hypothetical protein
MTEEHKEESTFSFGEYISPNPKPIPLGRFKPEPAVTYQIKKIVKYPDDDNLDDEERKEQSEETSTASCDLKRGDSMEQSVDSLRSVDSARDCKPRVSFKSPCIVSAATKKTKPFPSTTPAKVKVKKQAKEIEFLQAELRRLQFENEKLKSQSQSPQNEEANIPNQQHPQHRAPSRRGQEHTGRGRGDVVSFDPTVDIVNAKASLKNTTLHDKVSLMRSNRNSTPYKSKTSRPTQRKDRVSGHVQAEAKVLSATIQHEKTRNQRRGHKVEIKPLSKGKGCSRQQYRITPIPTKKKKSTKFKSKLQSIKQSEKENMNISNVGLEDTAPTPKDVNRLKKYATPSQRGQGGQHLMDKPAEVGMSKSFDFGRPPLDTPSETPSFLGGSSSLGSSFMDETPEFMNQRLQGQGHGASNITTPILTPTRGAETPDSKPFSFDWNKKK